MLSNQRASSPLIFLLSAQEGRLSYASLGLSRSTLHARPRCGDGWYDGVGKEQGGGKTGGEERRRKEGGEEKEKVELLLSSTLATTLTSPLTSTLTSPSSSLYSPRDCTQEGARDRSAQDPPGR